MKHLLFIVLLLFSYSASFSQEEDFAEFEADLREHFNNLGEEINEELDVMHEDEANLLAEIEEAKAEGEERIIASLEIELARVRVGITAWKPLSAKHQEIVTLDGEDFVDQEDTFSRLLENAHRQLEIAGTNARISHLEKDMSWLREDEEPDEAEEAALNRELKQAKAELKSQRELLDGWAKAAAAHNEGREEEAEQMERQLWMDGKDLAFQIESAEIRMRATEAHERSEELEREIKISVIETKMALALVEQREELRKVWQQTKKALLHANEEEREELLEEYHLVELKYELKREMMEISFQLSRAKNSGDEDEVDELERILEEIEEESRELDAETSELE